LPSALLDAARRTVMLAPSDARVRRVKLLLVWLAILTLVVATTSSCARIQDKSTEALIALLQKGE
jgi:hypothetical protein